MSLSLFRYENSDTSDFGRPLNVWILAFWHLNSGAYVKPTFYAVLVKVGGSGDLW